ncbi:MAG: hypothetical protein ACE5JB_14950 [bacterium]
MNKKTWESPQILTLEEGIGDDSEDSKKTKKKCKHDMAKFKKERQKKCKKKKGVKFS